MLYVRREGKDGMRPYYERDGITIYHGDACQVVPAIGAVDHVITDPPYEAEAHTGGRRLNGRTIELRDRGIREIDLSPLSFGPMTEHLRSEISQQIARCTRGWALVFCQAEAVNSWRMSLAEAGASYRRAMVWIKPDGAPQLSGDRPAMGYESIVASWCGQGRSVWNGGGRRGVFTHNKRDRGYGGPNVHQTQKPVALMSELVSLFASPGQLILDPFMGSGTTLVAAKRQACRAIGIEIEEKYCEVAAERLCQGVMAFKEDTGCERYGKSDGGELLGRARRKSAHRASCSAPGSRERYHTANGCKTQKNLPRLTSQTRSTLQLRPRTTTGRPTVTDERLQEAKGSAESLLAVLYSLMKRGNLSVGSADAESLALWCGLGQLVKQWGEAREAQLSAYKGENSDKRKIAGSESPIYSTRSKCSRASADHYKEAEHVVLDGSKLSDARSTRQLAILRKALIDEGDYQEGSLKLQRALDVAERKLVASGALPFLTGSSWP